MPVDETESAAPARYDNEASFYDSVYNPSDDIPYYVKHASQSRGNVLECACGTGRVTIPLARAGCRVTAFDVSGKMLAVARAKLKGEPEEVKRRIRLVQADMRSFELGERFDLSLIPFFSFHHLLMDQDVKSTLSHLYSHLQPGGRLVINVFTPDMKRPQGLQRLDKVVESKEGKIMRSSVQWFDTANHLTTGWLIYDFVSLNHSLSRRLSPFKLRYFFKGEMESSLRRTGFRVEGVLGDYEGNPFEKKSSTMNFVARKPQKLQVRPNSWSSATENADLMKRTLLGAN
jgi:ubiquinone/menaquinone biosynthesis C-methylase UbiE